MSKKLQPSGYQIINIDVSTQTSGTPFDPVTDDEKLLLDILSSGKINKPILLQIKTSSYNVIGLSVIELENESISIQFGSIGSSTSENIARSGTQLLWTEVE